MMKTGGISTLQTIAKMHSDFPTKFGIPRQSGMVWALESRIVFEPAFRNPDALRGLEGFSHLWLIWGFSESVRENWNATVRPPALGGNRRVGVFATRSPFRPNPIGLSSVQLLEIETNELLGPVIHVAGADLMDGTPIYDIKPYLPYADSHPGASAGFSRELHVPLQVKIPEKWLSLVSIEKREALRGILAQDPRPAYQDDEVRRYGVEFAGMEIKFTVADGCLTVQKIIPRS